MLMDTANMKTSKLTGTALDWAVSKCEGIPVKITRTSSCAEEAIGKVTYSIDFDQTWNAKGQECWLSYSPTYNWAIGGPILQKEGIELLCNLTEREAARFSIPTKADWQAFHRSDRKTEARQFANTPLIAAMRCYVARKLGDEVDIPKELQ